MKHCLYVGCLFAGAILFAEDSPNGRLDPSGISGSLVMCGGGKTPTDAISRFLELAGGENAQLVVIPTARANADSEPADKTLETWKAHKPKSVVVLHTRSRETANKDEFVEPLRHATGVWMSGGSQSRLADAYVNTRVEKELYALLQRGGVIGGTSSGAAVMSRVMIESGNQDAKLAKGFDLLPGAVVDQHFSQRNRQSRLLGVLVKKSGLFGVGIDEATALIVRGREMTVYGTGNVSLCLIETATRPQRIVELKRGGVADLTAWRRAAVARTRPAFPPPEPLKPVVPTGSLVIVGGGKLPMAVLHKFIELAGGPDAPIVVLPTAMENPTARGADAEFLKRAGARNIHVLPARGLHEVESPENLERLRHAKGIWFDGGRQWRFVDAYESTKALPLFHDVLRRGGVIGGTSAGATIQGDYLCRGSPLGNLEMMAEGYERGFGFLPGTAIDQHFAQRKRFADMTELMKVNPQLLGIGIDEETALVVQGKIGEVMGRHQVHFYDGRKPNDKGDPDYESVKSGDRYDLSARRNVEQSKTSPSKD